MIWFFITILIPNWLRQIVYKQAGAGKKINFIVSDETRWFFGKKKFFIGYLEEIGFALLFTIIWHFFPALGFTAHGWVSDALFDILIAFFIARGAKLPWFLTYQKTRFKKWFSFFFREILICYLIAGPVLWFLGLNIYYYAVLVSLIGVLAFLTLKYRN